MVWRLRLVVAYGLHPWALLAVKVAWLGFRPLLRLLAWTESEIYKEADNG